MWAQRLIAPERFELSEVPAPDAATMVDGQVLLRTTAGGICGSDLPFFRGGTSPAGSATAGRFGRPGFPLHEVTGEVVASRHRNLSAGEQVVGWASAFDGIAEQIITTGEGLAGYDPRMTPSIAISIQPLACVLYAMEQLGPVEGLHVAVIGQGPIGLLFSHVASSLGAARVSGVDRVDRSDFADGFGVDDAVHAASDRWAEGISDSDRPQVVIEAVGHQSATINHAISAVAPGGRIFYFGIPDETSYAVDLRTFLRKNLTLRAGATADRRRMLARAGTYLAEHPGLGERYVTHSWPSGQVEQAFAAAIRPAIGQAKITIEMPNQAGE